MALWPIEMRRGGARPRETRRKDHELAREYHVSPPTSEIFEEPSECGITLLPPRPVTDIVCERSHGKKISPPGFASEFKNNAWEVSFLTTRLGRPAIRRWPGWGIPSSRPLRKFHAQCYINYVALSMK